MSLHDLAVAAAELTKQPPQGQGLWVFPVPGCAPRDAVDRPQKAYRLFMADPAAQFIAVPTGVTSMMVAINIELTGLRWFRHNFARFLATRVHGTPGGGYNLLYKMPLPPVPILHCSHGKLARGVDLVAEGGSIIWPPSHPYGSVTPGFVVALDAPIAPLPRWIIAPVTAKPRPKERPVLRLPRRGIDMQRDRLVAYVKYSRQGTRADVTYTAGCAAGRLVAQGALGEAEAVALVTAAAVEAGLEPLEARKAALGGVRAALKEKSVAARVYHSPRRNPGADEAAAERPGGPRAGSASGSHSAVSRLPN
jgi:hypothetical protein